MGPVIDEVLPLAMGVAVAPEPIIAAASSRAAQLAVGFPAMPIKARGTRTPKWLAAIDDFDHPEGAASGPAVGD